MTVPVLRLFLLAAALLVPGAASTAEPAVKTRLSHEKTGWVVDYTFAQPSAVWEFRRVRDSLDKVHWRAVSFIVETPGVTFAHIGRHDVFYRADKRPIRYVRFRIVPFARPLDSDYKPWLLFSDGAAAFYTGHLAVSPMTAVPDADGPADIESGQVAQTLRVSAPHQSLRLNGQATTGTAEMPITDTNGTYLYAGAIAPASTPYMAQVVDPALPGWVRDNLDTLAPDLMRLYATRLGKPAVARPMVLMAWEGAERNGYSLSGGVVDGGGVMAIGLSGKKILSADPAVTRALQLFYAHEASHFWMGQAVRLTRREDAWISEGGADFLAVASLQVLDAAFDPRPRLQDELDQCLALDGPGEALATAEARGKSKGAYACGAILALAAESASRRHDTHADGFSFQRRLIDAGRATGTVTEALWLGQFADVASADLSQEVRAFIDNGVDDPKAFWERLFTATGVPFTRDGATLRLTEIRLGD